VKWLQIHITVDQAQVDFTETLLLSLGAVSVTLDDAEDQALLEPLPGETPLWNKVIVTGIYQQDDSEQIDVDSLIKFVQEQLPEAPVRFDELEDQAWERAWMDYYEPIQIAEKFWIVPEWLEAPDAEATNIKLDPGLAFGTGNHASTFLCLQWLGSIDLKDKIVVDYGCGSGILGVAALLLGAKKFMQQTLIRKLYLQPNKMLNSMAYLIVCLLAYLKNLTLSSRANRQMFWSPIF
jgi:ribosomal protein L11 methyltransferase